MTYLIENMKNKTQGGVIIITMPKSHRRSNDQKRLFIKKQCHAFFFLEFTFIII